MRVELLIRGVHPGPLNSIRDITLRTQLEKMKLAESTRLMAEIGASFNNPQAAEDSYKQFIDYVWYQNTVEKRNDRMMREYYESVHGKQVRLELDEHGKPMVKGL